MSPADKQIIKGHGLTVYFLENLNPTDKESKSTTLHYMLPHFITELPRHSGVLSDRCFAYNVFVLRLQQLGISSLFDD